MFGATFELIKKVFGMRLVVFSIKPPFHNYLIQANCCYRHYRHRFRFYNSLDTAQKECSYTNCIKLPVNYFSALCSLVLNLLNSNFIWNLFVFSSSKLG